MEMFSQQLYYEISLIRFSPLQISYLITLNNQYWCKNEGALQR